MPLTAETFNSALNDQEQYLPNISISPSEASERLELFLITLRDFTQARLLGSILTSAALIKACAVSGLLEPLRLLAVTTFHFWSLGC